MDIVNERAVLLKNILYQEERVKNEVDFWTHLYKGS